MVRIIIDNHHKGDQLPRKKVLRNLAQRVVREYPKSFQDDIGSGYDSLLSQLVYRVDNLSRPSAYNPKKRSTGNNDGPLKKKQVTDSYGCINWEPECLPDGESEETQQQKIKQLQDLYKSGTSNNNLITELMTVTFPTQRQMINAEDCVLDELTEKWPYLFEETFMLEHFQTLVGINLMERMQQSAEHKMPTAFKYMEQQTSTKKRLKDIIISVQEATKEQSCNLPQVVGTLLLLCSYFEQDPNMIFVELTGDVPMRKLDTPCILTSGRPERAKTLEISIGGKVTTKTQNPISAVAVWFSSFYILNLHYPTEIYNTTEFIQRWDSYKSTAWLAPSEIRVPVLKRPLRRQPKREDWPLIGHPSQIQRGDGVAVTRDDGSRRPRLIVYTNDPPNGKVTTTCQQTLRYELLVECPAENSLMPVAPSVSPQEPPRSPSPPPPFPQQSGPYPSTAGAVAEEVTDNSTSTPKTSRQRTSMTQKKLSQKRKSPVLVAKKQAKILCTGQPAVTAVAATPNIVAIVAPDTDTPTEPTPPPTEPTPPPIELTLPALPDVQSMEFQLLQLREMVDALVGESEQSAKKLSALQAKNAELEARVRELEEQRDDRPLPEMLSHSLHVANDSCMELSPIARRTPIAPQYNKENEAMPPISSTLPQNLRMSLACYAHNPREVGRQLAKIYFTEKERELCNCNGIRKPPLPPQKLAALRQELFSIVQTPVGQQAAVWRSVTKALDAETRSKLSYKKRTVLGEKLSSN